MKDEFTGQIFGFGFSHITNVKWSIVRASLLKVLTTCLQKFLGQNTLFKVQVSVSGVYKDFSLHIKVKGNATKSFIIRYYVHTCCFSISPCVREMNDFIGFEIALPEVSDEVGERSDAVGFGTCPAGT